MKEIIVVDGGSSDETAAIARTAGARVIAAPRGRGIQLAAGAGAAAGDWLLFLHADCRLSPDWESGRRCFPCGPEAADRAGYFDFALDDSAPAARRLERIVAWRCRVLALPYGDQGLLIARSLYRAVGGLCPAAVDGRRRPRSPPRPQASRPHRRAVHLIAERATAAKDTGVGRCATSSASRSISPACRPTGSCGSTDDAAHSRFVRPRPAARKRQASARARYRRCRSASLRAGDDRAAACAVSRPDRRWRLRIAVTPDKCLPSRPSLAQRGRDCRQGRGDLGIRMRRALETAPRPGCCSSGPTSRRSTPITLPRLSASLASHDLVFGPAGDGGFWLVGAASPATFAALVRAGAVVGPRCSRRHARRPASADQGRVCRQAGRRGRRETLIAGSSRAGGSESALQMFLQPRHQLDEIAWAKAVVELVDEDALPGVSAGARRSGEGK